MIAKRNVEKKYGSIYHMVSMKADKFLSSEKKTRKRCAYIVEGVKKVKDKKKRC